MAAPAKAGYESVPGFETWADPFYQAFRLLHFAFSVTFVATGMDKFAHFFANWNEYLSPAFAAASPLSISATMYLVGAVEVILGMLVAAVPRFGALLIAVYLGVNLVNLVLLRNHWDIVIRDFGLLLSAVALARLGKVEKRL